MTVLLSYSTSWCQSKLDAIPFTGELTKADSVLISYDDLRKANAKMIELKYQKEINDSLKSIIINDDIIIREYKTTNYNLNNLLHNVRKQRNIASYGFALSILSLLVVLAVN